MRACQRWPRLVGLLLVLFVCAWPSSVLAQGKDKPADSGDANSGDDDSGLAATIALIRDALKADQEGRLADCVDKDRQAIKIDDSPRTRLHLASCEARMGKLVDALKDAEKALANGIQQRDATVMRIAYQRVKELIDRIPHVTFSAPASATDLKVTFDDRPVPTDALSKKFSIDPGKHSVRADGVVNGVNSSFQEDYDIKEKELVQIRIVLKPHNDFVTAGQIKCMQEAKNAEEFQKCIPQNQKNLVVRIAGDISGYTDTNAVAVYTPGVNASLVSPTAGWNVGGNLLVDAVSAASPDIVASASPPFNEFRYAGGLTGGYKPGLYGAQGSFDISSSPDYVSYTGGLRFNADFNDKLVTPTFGYSYSYDRIARGPNNFLHSFNPLKGYLNTHDIDLGVTLILSPTSVLVLGTTVTIERGDGSQPYRYVPMFDPVVAPEITPGTPPADVNNRRLPVKPLEQLPTKRDRYAIGVRYNKRLSNATLRLEERVYLDTWGMKASSTDLRYMMDLSRRLRVWPHGRLHAQTDTSFHSLAYTAAIDPDGGGIIVPLYRTTDRELSPLVTFTGGGGVRLGLGELEGEVKYGVTFVGDVMYTRYLNSIYVTGRTAAYGTLGFDVEF